MVLSNCGIEHSRKVCIGPSKSSMLKGFIKVGSSLHNSGIDWYTNTVGIVFTTKRCVGCMLSIVDRKTPCFKNTPFHRALIHLQIISLSHTKIVLVMQIACDNEMPTGILAFD